MQRATGRRVRWHGMWPIPRMPAAPAVPATPQILGFGLPPAVRALLDQAQERRSRTSSDRSLARRLQVATHGAGLAGSGVTVYVHDGAVSLYGTLPDRATRDAWVTTVAGTPGVRRIVDSLRLAEA